MLLPHGFSFILRGEGRGSGGDFVWGEFVRDQRRLELHFRHSLGLVSYGLGESVVAHQAYLRALGVPSGLNQYPGFSDDPLDGFRHLAHDLSSFCADFLTGDGSVLREAAKAEMARESAERLDLMADYVGDTSKRRDARASFRAGAYDQTVALLESVHYPQLLSASERTMLDLARRRCGGPTSAAT